MKHRSESELLARALNREREHQRVCCLEQFSNWAHSFRCIVCHHRRKIEEARDPWTEVCVHCARRIGLRE